MRPCETVAKYPFTSTLLMLFYYNERQFSHNTQPLTTPSVTIAKHSSAHAPIRPHMPTVPNSEAEILCILKLL